MEAHQRELLNVSRIRRVDIDFQKSRAKNQLGVAPRKTIRKRLVKGQRFLDVHIPILLSFILQKLYTLRQNFNNGSSTFDYKNIRGTICFSTSLAKEIRAKSISREKL